LQTKLLYLIGNVLDLFFGDGFLQDDDHEGFRVRGSEIAAS
jgi:hypothetical protein